MKKMTFFVKSGNFTDNIGGSISESIQIWRIRCVITVFMGLARPQIGVFEKNMKMKQIIEKNTTLRNFNVEVW